MEMEKYITIYINIIKHYLQKNINLDKILIY